MTATDLDYISIKGFKSIASVEKVALRPINVLIGANGSGKSHGGQVQSSAIAERDEIIRATANGKFPGLSPEDFIGEANACKRWLAEHGAKRAQ